MSKTKQFSPIADRFRALARLVGIATVLISALSILVFVFQLFQLGGREFQLIALGADVAVALLAAGASLWLQTARDPSAQAHQAAQGLAAGVVLLAGAMIAARAFGWDLGIDSLSHQTITPPDAPQGGVPIATAMLLEILGLALLTLDKPVEGRKPAQGLALLAGTGALLSLIGHLYGVHDLYAIGPLSQITASTALVLLVVSVGIFLARPETGLMRPVASASLTGQAARRMIPAIIGIPILIGWIRLSGVEAGWYTTGFGISIATILSIASVGAIAKWTWQVLQDAEIARHLLAERLALAGQNLAVLTESIGDAHIETNAQGQIVEIDGSAEQLTGFSRKQALGRPIGEVLHLVDPETGAPAEPTATRVLRDGLVVGVVVRGALQRASGPPLPIEHCAAPLLNASGEITGVAVVFHDISAELREVAEQAWTMEMAMENRRVQEMNRARNELLGGISHEMRTLITGVVGFSEVLYFGQAGHITPDQHEYLGDILANSRRLWRLISDVVDFTDVKTGKISIDAEPLDLALVLREVLEVERAATLSKQIKLVTEVNPSLSYIVLDPFRLRQVLYNYISNALKATPEGGSISVRILPEGPNHFRLDVEDSGPGIASDDLPHVFEPFYHGVDRPTINKDETGMGLTITKRIVEALGGQVSVTSHVGQGSTFSAILPRRAGASDSGNSEGLRRSEGAAGRRILVVDDNAVNLKLMRILLSVEGYVVQTATDATGALAAIAQVPPELILLDMQLQGVDGVELTRRLCSDPATAHIPILAVTAYAMPGDEERALAAGCSGYITKPIDTRTFRAMVSRHLPPARPD